MVVTSRMSFFSDALGHSAFTGIAIGTLCGLADPLWMAVLLAAVFALLFTYVRRKSNMASDTVIGRLFLHRRGPGYLYCHLRLAAASPSTTACSSVTFSAWSPPRSALLAVIPFGCGTAVAVLLQSAHAVLHPPCPGGQPGGGGVLAGGGVLRRHRVVVTVSMTWVGLLVLTPCWCSRRQPPGMWPGTCGSITCSPCLGR